MVGDSIWDMLAATRTARACRYHILKQVEASLQRLKTRDVDILYLHEWDGMTPLEEVSALETLVQQGEIRYAGVSDSAGWPG